MSWIISRFVVYRCLFSVRALVVSACVAIAGPSTAHSATIAVGYISFDNLIPAGSSGVPGVNDFSINNLTGDPGAGGYALPPDFPVVSNAIFENSTLTVIGTQGTVTVNLGNLGPGSDIPIVLEFPDTDSFSSATFSATLSPAVLRLADGSSFIVGTQSLQVVLLPSAGQFLSPGADFARVQVSNTPEPGSGWLGLSVCLYLAFQKIRSKTC